MRTLPVLVLLLACGCFTSRTSVYVATDPDILTPRHRVPVYLKYSTVLFGTQVARYIDAIHTELNRHERVRVSRVVVYPHRGLFISNGRGIGKASAVRLKGSVEIKVEWWPGKGLIHYAYMRLRQINWSVRTKLGRERIDSVSLEASDIARQVVYGN